MKLTYARTSTSPRAGVVLQRAAELDKLVLGLSFLKAQCRQNENLKQLDQRREAPFVRADHRNKETLFLCLYISTVRTGSFSGR